ncbi:MAG: hypothetical protein ACTSW4_07230 [Candidatus Ranarchaeia archaeon]
MLLSLSVPLTHVAVASSYTRLRFKSIIIGNGLIVWGHSWIPEQNEGNREQNLVYGETEYFSNATSVFIYGGRANIWLHRSFYDHSNPAILVEEFWFNEVKAKGILWARWGNHHFFVVMRANENTEGAYILTTNTTTGEQAGLLVVGVNTSYGTTSPESLIQLFDPRHATIPFKGRLDGQRITGVLHVFGGDTPMVIVNLWIETLGIYVNFMWLRQDSLFPDITTEDPNDFVFIGEARLIKVKVNVK